MNGGYGGLRRVASFIAHRRTRAWVQTDRPSVTLRDCPVCGWPLHSVGHEVNCEEEA
jgi:hypothetical protein